VNHQDVFVFNDTIASRVVYLSVKSGTCAYEP